MKGGGKTWRAMCCQQSTGGHDQWVDVYLVCCGRYRTLTTGVIRLLEWQDWPPGRKFPWVRELPLASRNGFTIVFFQLLPFVIVLPPTGREAATENDGYPLFLSCVFYGILQEQTQHCSSLYDCLNYWLFRASGKSEVYKSPYDLSFKKYSTT